MKHFWEPFKEARTIVAILASLLVGVAFLAGHYDNISVLEYWALITITSASAVYLSTKFSEQRARLPLTVTFVLALFALGAIVYRQHLRYNDYDVGWDVAFTNGDTDQKSRGVQVGLCIINPNAFTVYARVAAISTDIDKASGSYKMQDPERVLPIKPYSSGLAIFSDPIPIGEADSGPHGGILQATVEYGRETDATTKQVPIRAEVSYVQNELSDVVGVSIDPTTGAPPGGYNLLPQMRESKCRRLGG